MAPSVALVAFLGALSLLRCTPADAEDSLEPLPGLRRVVVLARHGNRAPNEQIREMCPTFAREVLPKFGVAPAALSRVGMAENHENGVFLRQRYRDFLPQGPITYDGTFSFFSERVERNIVSTSSLAQGLFPIGTGMQGFARERPNIVPIATTQNGADVIMNCPRDGPCQRALSVDKKAWIAANEVRIYQQHKELFRIVSDACGYPLQPGKIVYKGKSKPLTWAAKAVMDAFTFSENEGLDATMSGRLNMSTIRAFHDLVEGMVHDMNFGKPHQITYWTGDFIPTFLGLARMPLHDKVNKLHVFLNHRELLYAVSHMLGMPIAFPGERADSVPSGSSLIMEVYDNGVRLFFWAPSRHPHDVKAWYLRKTRPMAELYDHGTLQATAAYGCVAGALCPVESLAYAFLTHVTKTGTYVKLCNVSEEDKYFAKGEASLGLMEDWIQPEIRAGHGASVTQSSVMAVGLTTDDAEALGFSLAADVEDIRLRGTALQLRDGDDGVSVALVAAVSVPLSLVASFIGFTLGRRSDEAPMGATNSAYQAISG